MVIHIIPFMRVRTQFSFSTEAVGALVEKAARWYAYSFRAWPRHSNGIHTTFIGLISVHIPKVVGVAEPTLRIRNGR